MKFIGSKDWFGEISPYAPEMAVEIEGDVLHFAYRCRKAPNCDKNLVLGEFVEGLWERDVAEFFVAGRGTSYQEVNISPTGAWWSCLFSDYRERAEVVRFEPEIQVSGEANSWSVDFKVRLEDLRPWRGLKNTERLFSVCSILHDPEPRYFAWNHSGGGEPDFHRRDLLHPFH